MAKSSRTKPKYSARRIRFPPKVEAFRAEHGLLLDVIQTTIAKEKGGDGGGSGGGGKRLTCDQALALANAFVAVANVVLAANTDSNPSRTATAAQLLGYAEGLVAGACPS